MLLLTFALIVIALAMSIFKASKRKDTYEIDENFNDIEDMHYVGVDEEILNPTHSKSKAEMYN